MKYYIGIDAGLDGGMVELDETGAITRKWITPTIKLGKGRKIDALALGNVLRECSESNCYVMCENPGEHAQSASGLRSMTYCYASIETLLTTFRIPYDTPRALKWQREFWTKPKMPKGQKFDTKAAALVAANKLWPKESWLRTERCSTPHDGMIDAALIAEYGRRKLR